MYKYTLSIGKNDADTEKQELSDEFFQNTIIETFACYGFMGLTLQDATGVWEGKTEKTVVVSLVVSGEEKDSSIIAIVAELKEAFNQFAIMVEKEEKTIDFR